MKFLLTLLLFLLVAQADFAQPINYSIPKDYRNAIDKADYKRLVDLSVTAISAHYRIAQVKDGTVELEKNQPFQALNLHNLIAKCVAVPDKNQWGDVVTDHFDKLFSSQAKQASLNVQNFDTAAKYLSLRIYPKSAVEQRGGLANLVTKIDLDGTYTMLMLDLPGAFTPIPKSLFLSWNKSAHEVFQIAHRNVNKQVVQKITKSFDVDATSIEISFLGNEDYAASYALDLANNSPELVGQWGSVVAMPNKGLVDICKIGPNNPLDFVKFIQRTKSLVEQSFTEHPQAISSRFFWYYQNRFTPITVNTGPKGEVMVVAPLALSELMVAGK